MLRTLLLVILILVLLGSLPLWPYAAGWGYGPSGGAGLLLGVGIFATLAQLAMTRAYSRGRTLVAASLAYTAVVFASLYIFALLGLVVNLISDLTYTWIDPRIDFETREV